MTVSAPAARSRRRDQHRYRRSAPARVAAGLVALAVLVLLPTTGGAAAAAAPTADAEQQLAEKYAPVVRLVHQETDCGPGEPFRPSDVDPLFDNPSVALRGPWSTHDLIEVAPSAEDLAHPLDGYALDFPGDPLKPGCSYETWFDRVWADSPATVYSHVVTQPDVPRKLALQYWFYYPFNDFNNKHESDWEMIQVEFDADTAAEALTTTPTRTVYSAHEGREQAIWGDAKLQLVDGTHPTVFVSAGSHSNHYESALFLLRSGSQGLGCDTTLDPDPGVAPQVVSVPSDAAAAAREFPWTLYKGGWGQAEARSFYNGPTGPEAKGAWTKPFDWSAEVNDRSYAVPGGSVVGVKTTTFFCGLVGRGSVTLREYTANPLPVLAVLTAVVIAVVWLVRRASWSTARAFPARQHRTFGETLVSVWLAYRRAPLLFLGISAVVAALDVLEGVARQLVTNTPMLAETSPQPHGWGAVLVTAGTLLAAVVTLISHAASVQTLADLDANGRAALGRSYALALRRSLPLVGTLVVLSVGVLLLVLTVWLVPLALALVIFSTAMIPVVLLERTWGPRALWRSIRLVRHQWVKVTFLMTFGSIVALVAGGLIGSLLLLAFQMPFLVVNLIPGVAVALVSPFLALLMGFIYFDGVAVEDGAVGEQEAQRDEELTPP